MDPLIIEPGKGIGTIELGMSRQEVEACIQEYTAKYRKPSYSKNYFEHVFMVKYDEEERVHFIEIPSSLKDIFTCSFRGMDVFNTKAEELVAKVDEISPYDRDDWELGYMYMFPALGLSFWRPNIFKEEFLQEEWFLEMHPDIQEDEKKHLYFESVSIKK